MHLASFQAYSLWKAVVQAGSADCGSSTLWFNGPGEQEMDRIRHAEALEQSQSASAKPNNRFQTMSTRVIFGM
jgi:hypothetical protein